MRKSNVSGGPPGEDPGDDHLATIRTAVRKAYPSVPPELASALDRVERALTEAARFRELFECAPDACVVTDAEGTVARLNHAAVSLLGGESEELVGEPLETCVAHADRSTFRALLAGARGGRTAEKVRLRLSAEDGVGARVSASAAPWRGTAGHVLWMIRDVTERMREEERARQLAAAEAARREAEAAHERITNILESISDGFVALDRDARVTYINRRAEELLRVERDELLGRNAWDAVPEARGTVFEHACRTALASSEPRTVEEFYRPLRGWVELHAIPTADGLGVYFRNITGRKRAEEHQRFLSEAAIALSSSIEFQPTIDTIVRLPVSRIADSAVLFLLDDHGVPYAAGSQHSEPELDERLRDALVLRPGGGSVVSTPVLHVLREGRTVRVPDVTDELLAEIADSTEHLEQLRGISPESLLVVPLTSLGRTFGALSLGCSAPRAEFSAADEALAEELAARAALALDNARLYAESQRDARAREEILHLVSHDLRNTVNAATLQLDMLDLTAAKESSRTPTAALRRALTQMQRMVRDLLDAESMASGRFGVHAKPADLAALLQEATDSLHAVAAERRVRLELAAESTIPRVRVDAERLQQVLSNLVGNAVKFSGAGSAVRIVACIEEHTGDVEVRVEDRGCGIKAEEVPFVFERFWQGPNARRSGRGAGLGLAIARGIVEAHGGRIWVESEPGQGSTFGFTIPRNAEDA
jgi:PAS domain S-box-containing protein